LTDKM